MSDNPGNAMPSSGDMTCTILIGIGNVKQLNTGLMSRMPIADDEIPATGHQSIVATAQQRIDDMIHRAERMPRRAPSAVLRQTVQGHAAGSLMQKNTIDIQQGLTLDSVVTSCSCQSFSNSVVATLNPPILHGPETVKTR